MTRFNSAQLLSQVPANVVNYHEFLRRPALSVGLYTLPAGSRDPQQPHREDEVYVVLSGQATFHAADGARPVGQGDVLYVAAGEAHRFTDITAALTLIVFFAPAESDG